MATDGRGVTSEEQDEGVWEIDEGEVQATLGLDLHTTSMRLWVDPELRGCRSRAQL